MSGTTTPAAQNEPAGESQQEQREDVINPLAMSDADFLNQAHPPVGAVDGDMGSTETSSKDGQSEGTTTDPVASVAPVASAAPAGTTQEPVKVPPVSPGSTAKEDSTNAGEGDKTSPQDKSQADASDTPPDYEGFYKTIMTPFKANGKTVELKSPDEAVRLMQMGANYTRKMQELSGNRKFLLMLENNGLLDENRLSFLIDLDKKNPEAIQKLLKDAKVDPTEIDMTAEPAYREGNHRVTDAEVTFADVLSDLQGTENGKATLQAIHGTWDQASKEVLWKSPQVMRLMDEQRQTGVYQRIEAEIDRRRTLGQLPPETPFLEAYRVVGDQLLAANAFEDLLSPSGSKPPANNPGNSGGTTQTPANPPVPVVANRVATPKPPVANNAQAAAASPSRTAPPKKTGGHVNFLAMSDEDFLKSMSGRV